AERARKEARLDRDKARDAEGDTGAFSDFLVDHVLSVPRPEGIQKGLGVHVTMAQALEAAEKEIDRVFAGRPKAEATARNAIGATWRNLGRYAAAEKHLRRAVDLRRRELGPDAADTLDSCNSLGVTLGALGRPGEAVLLLEDTLKRREASLGPEGQPTLSTA